LPQNSAHFDSIIYVGPEKTSILKEYGFGFEKIKMYYRFGLFDGISKIIGSLMEFIYKIVPNWGVSIIVKRTPSIESPGLRPSFTSPIVFIS